LREKLTSSGKKGMALKYLIHAYHLKVKYAIAQKKSNILLSNRRINEPPN